MSKYSKTTVNGQTVNKWTAELFRQTQQVYNVLGGTGYLRIVQGSWSDGSLSAGTHSKGGGVIDVMPFFETEKNYKTLQLAMRYVMFAAWHRTKAQGPWDDHVHAVLLGDTTVHPLAAAQRVDYKASPPRNGLKGHAVDNSYHPRPFFTPNYGMRNVSLSVSAAQAKRTRNYIPRAGVMRIQRALNLKVGSNLRINGLFNKATKDAFVKWEKKCGGNGDGIPGKYSLTLLGAGRFFVTK